MATTEDNDPGVGEDTTWSVSDLAGNVVTGFSRVRDTSVEAVTGVKGGSAATLALGLGAMLAGLSLVTPDKYLEGAVLCACTALLFMKGWGK